MLYDLRHKYDLDTHKFVFISFNGSNFDDYFLLQASANNDEYCSAAAFQTKSILGLKGEDYSCWDMRKFLTTGSLAENCKSFNVYP